MSPVKYELGFSTPEDDILHSDRRALRKSHSRYTTCVIRTVRLPSETVAIGASFIVVTSRTFSFDRECQDVHSDIC
jgi:hypothetical protein